MRPHFFNSAVIEKSKLDYWLPVNDRIFLNDAVMMYKCINKLVPDYLIEKFTLRSQTHTRNTRQCDQLNIPRCRLTTGQRSFTYRGAKLWNNLRVNVKSSDSVKVFRKKIVNLLFSDQSVNLWIVNNPLHFTYFLTYIYYLCH